MDMIDFETFKNYLEIKNKDHIYIPQNKLISHNEIIKINILINKYKKNCVRDCIERTNKINGTRGNFIVETLCNDCHEVRVGNKNMNRTEFDKYLNGTLSKYFCEKCEMKKEKEKKEESEKSNKWIEERKNQEKNKTSEYIEYYLDPNKQWNKGVKIWDKWNQINNSVECDWNIIQEYIRSMDYNDFLKTPYWKAVAQQKRKQADFKCQLCNENDTILSVHHRNYKIKGREIFNMKDLTVLCDKCHKKHHNIK